MVHEKNSKKGGLPKKGTWAVNRFNRRLSKKEEVLFLRGVIPNTHYGYKKQVPKY